MTSSKIFTLLVLASLPARAVLLAHYDFTDGDLTDNEVGAAETLTLINQGANQITITPAGSAIFPGEVDADRDYLEVERGLGASAFTVSIWFKTETLDQGLFQGIFSNNIINAANNFSWQVDVHNGNLRLVSASTGFPGITNAEAGEPQIQTGVWNQVVVRKLPGDSAELWLGTEDTPLQSLGTADINPGGLQWFRLGINRNSDSLYAMEMANVKIYDDSIVSLIDLNNEGPQLRTEPGFPAGLDLRVTPNPENPGNFDFTWTGRDGKVYDIVSSTDLSSAPQTWSVWQGNEDLAGTPPLNTLVDLPGGGDSKRFFAIIERDSTE